MQLLVDFIELLLVLPELLDFLVEEGLHMLIHSAGCVLLYFELLLEALDGVEDLPVLKEQALKLLSLLEQLHFYVLNGLEVLLVG